MKTSSARPRTPERPRALGEALAYGRATLARHRCARTDAAREAEALLTAAARVTREQLFTHPERALSPAAWRRYDAWLARRLKHEPLDYILGFAAFDGLIFKVNRSTLVPRPATECLVETAAAEAIKLSRDSARADLLVADIGTGSGCIALALVKRLPGTEIVATDTSASALCIARANAKRLGIGTMSLRGAKRRGNLRFLKGNLAAPVIARSGATKQSRPRPLLLVTNPPYIPTAQLRRLPADVRLFEPTTALDGGRDGLDCYRALLDQLQATPTGPITLVGEHLDTQFARLAKEIKKRFPNAQPEPILNLAGIVIGTKGRLR
jgi:release factor glutamine methyltransferase